MTCPHCGGVIETPQARHQQRLRAQGRCVTCGRPKSAADGDRYQCRACRLTRAAKARARYLRRTRADVREQRA